MCRNVCKRDRLHVEGRKHPPPMVVEAEERKRTVPMCSSVPPISTRGSLSTRQPVSSSLMTLIIIDPDREEVLKDSICCHLRWLLDVFDSGPTVYLHIGYEILRTATCIEDAANELDLDLSDPEEWSVEHNRKEACWAMYREYVLKPLSAEPCETLGEGPPADRVVTYFMLLEVCQAVAEAYRRDRELEAKVSASDPT